MYISSRITANAYNIAYFWHFVNVLTEVAASDGLRRLAWLMAIGWGNYGCGLSRVGLVAVGMCGQPKSLAVSARLSWQLMTSLVNLVKIICQILI